MEDGNYVNGSIWFYAPNKGAPVFFAVANAISGVWHIYQCIHYKCWKLTGLYVMCAILFTGGYIAREIGAFYYGSLPIYIVSICLIYFAPPLFELGNYQSLGRVLYYVPYLSPIHPGRVLTTFTMISAVVEALNGNGASYSANQSLPPSKQEVGHWLLKAALIMQLGIVALFVILAVVFHRRCARAGLATSNINNAMATLYASTALITARTVYRTVEYFAVAKLRFTGGVDPSTFSPIIRYEWYFYVFEGTLMLANTFLINARHPRRYLPHSNKIYLDRDGVTEIEGAGYKDPRSFLATLFDPFNLAGMLKGRDKKKENYWETDVAGSTEEQDKRRAGPQSDQNPEAA